MNSIKARYKGRLFEIIININLKDKKEENKIVKKQIIVKSKDEQYPNFTIEDKRSL